MAGLRQSFTGKGYTAPTVKLQFYIQLDENKRGGVLYASMHASSSSESEQAAPMYAVSPFFWGSAAQSPGYMAPRGTYTQNSGQPHIQAQRYEGQQPTMKHCPCWVYHGCWHAMQPMLQKTVLQAHFTAIMNAQIRSTLKFRMGQLYNDKLACRYGHCQSSNARCVPLVPAMTTVVAVKPRYRTPAVYMTSSGQQHRGCLPTALSPNVPQRSTCLLQGECMHEPIRWLSCCNPFSTGSRRRQACEQPSQELRQCTSPAGRPRSQQTPSWQRTGTGGPARPVNPSWSAAGQIGDRAERAVWACTRWLSRHISGLCTVRMSPVLGDSDTPSGLKEGRISSSGRSHGGRPAKQQASTHPPTLPARGFWQPA